MEREERYAVRQTAINDLDPVRSLLMGATAFHDEAPSQIMVPSVFCNGRPIAIHWYGLEESRSNRIFPPSIQTRDRAWEEIVDYTDNGVDIDFVPKKLVDAWSDFSKSREFLNMRMDREDVDNMYLHGCIHIRRLEGKGACVERRQTLL